MTKKNVTIGELKAAAKRQGWPNAGFDIYRSPVARVVWSVSVTDFENGHIHLFVRWHSKQGAMRMALAALRAK